MLKNLGLKLKLRIVKKKSCEVDMRFCGGWLKLIIFKNLIVRPLTTSYYSFSQVNPKILPADLLGGVKHKTQSNIL